MTDKNNYLRTPAVASFIHQLKELILSNEPHFVRNEASIEELTFLEFADQYHYKGKSLQETQAELNPLMQSMQEALRTHDNSTMLSRCLRTLIWGKVTNSASTNWLVDAFDNNLLTTELSRGLAALTQDSYAKLEIFHENKIRSDSALTKIYAFLDANSVIADGRAFAALCLIAKASLESNGYDQVVKELDFTVDRSTTVKRRKRDPSKENFKFSTKTTGYPHAIANLHTNWILGTIAADPEVQTWLNVNTTEQTIRKIEAGLFMIGKDISQISVNLPERQEPTTDINLHKPEENDNIARVADVEEIPNNEGFTNGPSPKRFTYHTTDALLIIERGRECHIRNEFSGVELIHVLTSLRYEFGNDYFYLANNVATVSFADAMRGLGKTIYELTGNPSAAQAASQLAPLLHSAGIFQWNGAYRGAMYSLQHVPGDWPVLRTMIDGVAWPNAA